MASLKCFTPSRRHFASNLGAKAMRSGPTSTPSYARSSRLYCAALTLTDFLYLGQAGDLKRLLELYIGWQQRILPFSTFDAFLEALEKLGSSYVLKVMHMCTQHGHWPLMLSAKQAERLTHSAKASPPKA